MSAIDVIILGILKQEPHGAYDIQKAVEYRNISKWVKVVYKLTKSGEEYFNELMLSLSDKSLTLLFDFNAIIVNLNKVSMETQEQCLNAICKNINELRVNLENMIEERKHIPQYGQSVLQ